jgi:hypothetical protein
MTPHVYTIHLSAEFLKWSPKSGLGVYFVEQKQKNLTSVT